MPRSTKSIEDRIAKEQAVYEQSKARLEALQTKKKAADEQKRQARFIRIGEYLESKLPDIMKLADKDLLIFLDRSTTNEHGSRTLKQIMPSKPTITSQSNTTNSTMATS